MSLTFRREKPEATKASNRHDRRQGRATGANRVGPSSSDPNGTAEHGPRGSNLKPDLQPDSKTFTTPEDQRVVHSNGGSSEAAVPDRSDSMSGIERQQASSAVLADTAAQKRRSASLVPIVGLALLLVALPAIFAYFLASSQDEVFVAEVDVMHEITDAQFGDVDRVMANAKIDAERRELAAVVADRYDITVDDFISRRNIEIVVSDTGATSTVSRFKVENESPRTARRQVALLADAYLADQVVEDPDAQRRADLEGTISDLQSRRLSAQDGIAAAQTAKDTATFDGLTAAEYTERVAELDRNRVAAGSRYDEIVRDLDTQLRLLESLEPDGLQVSASLLSEPFASDEPVSPKPLRSLALGLAVGLLLAGTWLFAALQFRSR